MFSAKAIDMASFTARLPVRPHQEFDLILNIVGLAASRLVKDSGIREETNLTCSFTLAIPLTTCGRA